MQSADPIQVLLQTYHDLNPALLDELEVAPTPLQFQRYVARNRPFVVRNAAREWPAVKKWNAYYLRQKMAGRDVKVAVTPKGNADAVVEDQHQRLLFVEPHEVYEPFESFLDYIQQDSAISSLPEGQRNVKYAQPQNDSLRLEYAVLAPDVPSHIDFFSSALETEIDGVNFWLGNERSVTSLHKDNYENCYVQIKGTKHFTLLPPVEMPCVNETPLQFARYHSTDNDEQLEPVANPSNDPVPVPIWDPDRPKLRTTAFSHLSRPIRATLREGDMMYLPALWYHKVSQGNGEEGFSCSVNYWYDMDFSGSFWASHSYLRDTYGLKTTAVQYPALSTLDKDNDNLDFGKTTKDRL